MAPITHVPEHRIWVLTAAEAGYVLHLGSDDLPRTLHWGRAMTAPQAVSLLEHPPPRARSCEDASDGLLDLNPQGGLRYGYPSLQVRFADGTRDLALAFTGAHVEVDASSAELVLGFADEHYPLSVNAHYRVRPDTPAIERRLTLRHTGSSGSAPISVLRADSACWVVPELLGGYRLSHTHGQWSAEGTIQRSTRALLSLGMALAERAASIGVELFVMDDGWFGARTDDTAGLGDWYPNPERFPDGLGPLIEHVHSLGMKFGLWVGPEMTNPDSELYRAHPDWIVHRPHRGRTLHRHQCVLNLALPHVADHVHAAIDGLLRENAVDFLKWDMNRPLTEVDDALWPDYVTNLYRVLDRPRADHPDVSSRAGSIGSSARTNRSKPCSSWRSTAARPSCSPTATPVGTAGPSPRCRCATSIRTPSTSTSRQAASTTAPCCSPVACPSTCPPGTTPVP